MRVYIAGFVGLLVSLGLAGLVGYEYGKTKVLPKVEVVTKTKVVKEKETTTRPDGTVIVRETDSKEDTAAESVPVVKERQPDWSVTVQVDVKEPGLKGEVTAGRRLLGSSWGVVSYDLKDKDVKAGIRIDF
jgi:hypothetical protein